MAARFRSAKLERPTAAAPARPPTPSDAGKLHRHRLDSSRRILSPAFGEKRAGVRGHLTALPTEDRVGDYAAAIASLPVRTGLAAPMATRRRASGRNACGGCARFVQLRLLAAGAWRGPAATRGRASADRGSRGRSGDHGMGAAIAGAPLGSRYAHAVGGRDPGRGQGARPAGRFLLGCLRVLAAEVSRRSGSRYLRFHDGHPARRKTASGGLHRMRRSHTTLPSGRSRHAPPAGRRGSWGPGTPLNSQPSWSRSGHPARSGMAARRDDWHAPGRGSRAAMDRREP